MNTRKMIVFLYSLADICKLCFVLCSTAWIELKSLMLASSSTNHTFQYPEIIPKSPP